MSYVKAEEVLPMEIIELIQQYVDGTNLYIPRKEENRASWGESNSAKVNLFMRDTDIYREYLAGMKVQALAEKYYLSEKSIWRILRKMKHIA